MCRKFRKTGCAVKFVVAGLALIHLVGLSPADAQNVSNAAIRWSITPAYQTPIDIPQTALKIRDSSGVIRQMYDESHAVLIIQGKYRGKGFQPVVDQAAASEKLLTERLEKLNFRVVVWRDLTGRRLKAVMDEVATKLGDRTNSRLFFYYFGHGMQLGSPDDAAGTRGFLVPVDADAPSFDQQGFREKAYPFEYVVATAGRMTLKHAFFAFEACRAGKIFDTISTLGGDRAPSKSGYIFRTDIQKSIRQFLTAGNAEQDVPADGTFTSVLAEALSERGDNSDGYITGEDVFRYVSRQLPKITTTISPRYGSIPQISSGDMILGPAGERVAQNPADNTQGQTVASPGPTIVRKPSQQACANSVLAKNNVKDGSLGMIGIDISHHYSVSDWNAVAKSGISFVYLKASEGSKFKDPAFKANWKAAGEAGLLRGAYHFFDQNPEVSAADQVKNFLSSFEGLTFGPCDLPPVVDWEWQWKNPSLGWARENLYPVTDQVIANAQAILESLEQAFRMRPILYTSSTYWQDIGGAPAGFEQYPLWIADYNKSKIAAGTPRLLAGRSQYVFWQDTEDFVVPGIKGGGKNGGVDRSMFNGTAAELKALTR